MKGFRNFDLPFEGTTIRCWEAGSGPAIVLLHGSGAGAYTITNFGRALPLLARSFRVIAADLVGFGLSGFRTDGPLFDMSMWARQAEFLLAYAGPGATLVGHSLSGSIVLDVASRNPGVKAVVTTGTTGTVMDVPPGALGWTWPNSVEEMRRQALRQSFDASLVTDEWLEARAAIWSRPGYGDYFKRMFDGTRKHFLDLAVVPSERLQQIRVPVLLMHGLQDASFQPEETSVALARSIPDAEVLVLPRCAHGVAFDRTDRFVHEVERIASG